MDEGTTANDSVTQPQLLQQQQQQQHFTKRRRSDDFYENRTGFRGRGREYRGGPSSRGGGGDRRRQYQDRGGERGERDGYDGTRSADRGGGRYNRYGDQRYGDRPPLPIKVEIKNRLIQLSTSIGSKIENLRGYSTFLKNVTTEHTHFSPTSSSGAQPSAIAVSGTKYLTSAIFSPESAWQSELLQAFPADLIECVLSFPHYHSVYAALVVAVVKNLVPIEFKEEERCSTFVTERATRGAPRGGGTGGGGGGGEVPPLVKVEEDTVNVVETTAVSGAVPSGAAISGAAMSGGTGGELETLMKGETDNMEDVITGSGPSLVKGEMTDQERAFAYAIVLLELIIGEAMRRIDEIFSGEKGIHYSRNMVNVFRFLADMVNTNFVTFRAFANIAKGLVANARELLSSSEMDETEIMVDEKFDESVNAPIFLLSTAAEMLFNISPLTFTKNREEIESIVNSIEETAKFPKIVKHLSSPGQNMPWIRKMPGSRPRLTALVDSLRCLVSEKFVSRASPRIYESPKLELQGFLWFVPISVKTLPQMTCDSWEHFSSCFLDTIAMMKEDDNIIEEHPADQLNSPEDQYSLRWQEPSLASSHFQIFPSEELRKLISIQPMHRADQFLTFQMIISVLQSAVQDPAHCAETILMLPVQHDHFLHHVVDALLSLFLARAETHVLMARHSSVDVLYCAKLMNYVVLSQAETLGILTEALYRLMNNCTDLAPPAVEFLTEFIAVFAAFSDLNASAIVKETLTRIPLPEAKGYLKEKKEGDNIVIDNKDDDQEVLSIVQMKMDGDTPPGNSPSLNIRPLDEMAPATSLAPMNKIMYRILRSLAELISEEDFQDVCVGQQLRCLVPRKQTLEQVVAAWLPTGTDPQMKRELHDVHELMSVEFCNKPPLEFFILRQAMKLHKMPQEAVDRLIELLYNFLVAQLEQPPLSSLANILEEYFDVTSKKTKDETVKEDEAQDRATEGVGDDAGAAPAFVVKVDEDAAAVVEDKPEEINNVFQSIDYQRISGTNAIWSQFHLRKLVINTILVIGSKSLSHSKRAIERFRPLLLRISGDDLPSIVKKQEDEERPITSSETLVCQAAIRLWAPCSLQRLRFVLLQLLQSGIISRPESLVDSFCGNRNFLTTIGGEFVRSQIVNNLGLKESFSAKIKES